MAKPMQVIKIDEYKQNGKRYIVLVSGNMAPQTYEREQVVTMLRNHKIDIINMKLSLNNHLIDDTTMGIELTEERAFYIVISKNIQHGYATFYSDILSKLSELTTRKFEFGRNNSLAANYKKQAKEFGDRLIGMLKAYHSYMRPIKGKLCTTKILVYNTVGGNLSTPNRAQGDFLLAKHKLNTNIGRYSNVPAIRNWEENWDKDPSSYDCFVAMLDKLWNLPITVQYTNEQKEKEILTCIEILRIYLDSLLPGANYSIMHHLFLMDLNTGIVGYLNNNNSALPIHILSDIDRKKKLDEVLKNMRKHYADFRNNVDRCSGEVNRYIDRNGDKLSNLFNRALPNRQYKENEAKKKYSELLEFERTENKKLFIDVMKMLGNKDDAITLQARLEDMSNLAQQVTSIATNPFLALLNSAPIVAKYTKTLESKFSEKAMRIYRQYSEVSPGRKGVIGFILEWQKYESLNQRQKQATRVNICEHLKPLYRTLTGGGGYAFINYAHNGNNDRDWHAQLSWFVAYTICMDRLNGIQAGHQIDSIYWKIFKDSYTEKLKNMESALDTLKDALLADPDINLDIGQEIEDVTRYIDFSTV